MPAVYSDSDPSESSRQPAYVLNAWIAEQLDEVRHTHLRHLSQLCERLQSEALGWDPARLAQGLLVLAGVGHIHAHVCLDGKEPAQTVHFENLPSLAHHDDHGDHADDADHVDVENDLIPQGLLFKAPNHDVPLFLLVLAVLPTLEAPASQEYSTVHSFSLIHPPPSLLPPSRAPPVRS